jgi:hypothetical protein
VVRLGTFSEVRRVLGRPPIACLTGLKTQVAFEGPEDLLHGLPLCVMGADLLGAQAQPVGRVVLAAVSHHQYLQFPRQLVRGVPVRLPQILRQRRPLEPPILLQLADKVPAIITDALEELLRRIPRIEQDSLRFPPQTMPCITQKFQGEFAF